MKSCQIDRRRRLVLVAWAAECIVLDGVQSTVVLKQFYRGQSMQ